MTSPDPSPNGDPVPPDSFEMRLEPVDPAELDVEAIPTVEAVTEVPRRGMGFWKALLWCLLFLVITQIVPGIVTVIVLALVEMPAPDRFVETLLRVATAESTTQLLIVVGPTCGILFSLLVLPRALGRDWKRRIALRVPHLEHVVLTVLLIFPFLVFNVALQALLQYLFAKMNFGGGIPELENVMKSMTSWPWWLLVLGMSVGPAVSEELWCRGFLGQGLAARYGLAAGIVLTSLLFGLIHLIPLQAIAAAMMGVALHLVYIATRSIFIPMLLHFLNNALALLADAQDSPLLIGKSLEHALDARPALFLFASIWLAAVIGIAFWQSRVRVIGPGGGEVPRSLYPHAETPAPGSANRAVIDPPATVTVGLLVAAAGFFAAIWFGV
jgi:membrane protease YdiL (CAAX protease family)